MRKDNDRKHAEKKQQAGITMTWTGKISITETSCHPLSVGELELCINHHNIAFKGKKH